MDFLKDMKAKLEELEREAQRQMQQQQQAQQQNLFQPKGKGGQKQRRRQQGQGRQDTYARGGGPQQSGQRRAERPVDPSISHRRPSQDTPEMVDVGSDSLLDDLGGHLEEAFLLQEVLGLPRCMRGWDE